MYNSKFKMIICSENTVDSIKKYVNLLILFLQETSTLTESYVLDFFVKDHWNKLPVSWKEILQDFEIKDLVDFLSCKESLKLLKPLPLGLLAFRKCAFELPLLRKSITSSHLLLEFLQVIYSNQSDHFVKIKKIFSNTSEWDQPMNEFINKSGQHKSIPEFCRRHVKRKKQHEIFRLAQITNLLLQSCDIKYILDIGSGQGHLSRLLALCYNFNVATIEAEGCHVTGASTFDKQAFLLIKKKKNQRKFNELEYCEHLSLSDKQILPYHLKGYLKESSSTKEYIEKISKSIWSQDTENDVLPQFALLGLHTCGDLAVTILKTFTEIIQSQVLLSVGCCYMKLNSTSEDEGYPLSFYVKSLSNNRLSYEAREVACHALEMYIQKLKDNSPVLKIHCYRATLEKCIVHYYPDKKHLGLRGVKHAELLEFHEYAEKALKKVSIHIPKEFFLSSEIKSCLNEWKKVLLFYSLRLIIAPVVESLILLDRMLFLFEKDCPSCIVPIFEPVISPRNHVIISLKNHKETISK